VLGGSGARWFEECKVVPLPLSLSHYRGSDRCKVVTNNQQLTRTRQVLGGSKVLGGMRLKRTDYANGGRNDADSQ